MGHKRRDMHYTDDGRPKTPHTREEAEARAARIAVESKSPDRHRVGPYQCHCGAWHIGKAPTRAPSQGTAGLKIYGRRSVERHPELVLELGQRATNALLFADKRFVHAVHSEPFAKRDVASLSKAHRQQLRRQRRHLARLLMRA